MLSTVQPCGVSLTDLSNAETQVYPLSEGLTFAIEWFGLSEKELEPIHMGKSVENGRGRIEPLYLEKMISADNY